MPDVLAPRFLVCAYVANQRVLSSFQELNVPFPYPFNMVCFSKVNKTNALMGDLRVKKDYDASLFFGLLLLKRRRIYLCG